MPCGLHAVWAACRVGCMPGFECGLHACVTGKCTRAGMRGCAPERASLRASPAAPPLTVEDFSVCRGVDGAVARTRSFKEPLCP
eukprot:351297-Chlamydomonas_euryale.AAC.12